MATTKGIMGWVDLGGAAGLNGLRVTSCGLKASQEVSTMDTIDSAYDYTAYRLGPVRIEGDLAFPIPVKNNKWDTLLEIAAKRDPLQGTLLTNNIDVTAAYDHQIAYRYGSCSVNTYSVSISSEEAVEATMNVIGTEREPVGKVSIAEPSPERVLTWNEVEVNAAGGMTPTGPSVTSFKSDQVKNFSFEINNNTSVFFALNKSIFAVQKNIVAGKREVTGSIEISWNESGLANHAYLANAKNGKDNCGSDQYITVDLVGNCGASSPAQVKFWGIVYNMEEISLTNDFFMGTQTWRAYGHSGNSYKAISLGGTAI